MNQTLRVGVFPIPQLEDRGGPHAFQGYRPKHKSGTKTDWPQAATWRWGSPEARVKRAVSFFLGHQVSKELSKNATPWPSLDITLRLWASSVPFSTLRMERSLRKSLPLKDPHTGHKAGDEALWQSLAVYGTWQRGTTGSGNLDLNPPMPQTDWWP